MIESLAGHVTEAMPEHASTVDVPEKRQAIAAFGSRLVLSSENRGRGRGGRGLLLDPDENFGKVCASSAGLTQW